jgi:hypothetical protein
LWCWEESGQIFTNLVYLNHTFLEEIKVINIVDLRKRGIKAIDEEMKKKRNGYFKL